MMKTGMTIALSAGISLGKNGNASIEFNEGNKKNPDKMYWGGEIDLSEVSAVAIGADHGAKIDKKDSKTEKEKAAND